MLFDLKKNEKNLERLKNENELLTEEKSMFRKKIRQLEGEKEQLRQMNEKLIRQAQENKELLDSASSMKTAYEEMKRKYDAITERIQRADEERNRAELKLRTFMQDLDEVLNKHK